VTLFIIGAAKHGASGGKRRRFRRNCVRDDAPTATAAGNREKKGEAATRARDAAFLCKPAAALVRSRDLKLNRRKADESGHVCSAIRPSAP